MQLFTTSNSCLQMSALVSHCKPVLRSLDCIDEWEVLLIWLWGIRTNYQRDLCMIEQPIFITISFILNFMLESLSEQSEIMRIPIKHWDPSLWKWGLPMLHQKQVCQVCLSLHNGCEIRVLRSSAPRSRLVLPALSIRRNYWICVGLMLLWAAQPQSHYSLVLNFGGPAEFFVKVFFRYGSQSHKIKLWQAYGRSAERRGFCLQFSFWDRFCLLCLLILTCLHPTHFWRSFWVLLFSNSFRVFNLSASVSKSSILNFLKFLNFQFMFSF